MKGDRLSPRRDADMKKLFSLGQAALPFRGRYARSAPLVLSSAEFITGQGESRCEPLFD
jgi:hypothetical protein